MELTNELREFLHAQGAALVGFGDMSEVAGCGYRTGISVAIPLPKHVVTDLKQAPTEEYYHLYHTMNEKLNRIVSAGEQFLTARGFEAYAQTTDRVTTDEHNVSRLPHKTVATRCGLGWIGKNGLLITEDYGSAIRLSSLLTNAPLAHDAAINHSRCGSCDLCVTSCPAKAIKGRLWQTGVPRHEIVDVNICLETQLRIMKEQTGIEADLCGKCFAVCMYTQNYLKSERHENNFY